MLAVQSLSLLVPASRVRGQATLFSNQVSHLEDAVLDASRCAFVRVESFAGSLGVYCKNELRAVRLLPTGFTSGTENPTRESLVAALTAHLDKTHARKRQLVPAGALRWIHGEADGLPGLVIDHYGSLVVVQSSAAAGEFLLPFVVEALARTQCGETTPVLERSSGQTRALAGLPERTRVLQGNVPEKVLAEFGDLGLEFTPRRAQKTGLFLDQRTNLALFATLLGAARYESLLDVCCYAGAWSAQASRAGLTRFTLVDQDKEALARAEQNVRHNARAATSATTSSAAVPPSDALLSIEPRHGDLFEALSVLAREGKTFDVVVGDPPAFAKSKKHIPEARRAYARLAKLAAKLVRPGGLYIACSCSRNMEEAEFLATVEAQLTADSSAQWDLVLRGSQAADHTVPAGDTLSAYLKCAFYRRREEGA